MEGFLKDGGLYFPESVPEVSIETLEAWSVHSYPDIVKRVMKLFIDETEIPAADLDQLIDNAFRPFKDPAKPISVARLKGGLNVAELFNGPTLAFKVKPTRI